MDDIVQEDNSEGTPDAKTTPLYWRRWVRTAKDYKKAKQHRDETAEAWAEYDKRSVSTLNDSNSTSDPRPFPIYWASCKLIESAYYTRPSKVYAKREHGINDPVALTACSVLEHLANYLIKNCEYDTAMRHSVLDFIHGDKATTQLLYDYSFASDGSVIPERVRIARCRYDKILHSPSAESQDEITEVAYPFCMERSKAEKRFTPEVVKDIQWKTAKEKKDDDDYSTGEEDIVGEYLEGYECWCKDTKHIYWISDQYIGGFLDQRSDFYKLRKFFPSPSFAIGNLPEDSLYPTPVYVHLKPLIAQLHEAMRRVQNLVPKTKRRVLVTPGLEDLVHALESLDEAEFIVTKDLNTIVEKGSLENAVKVLEVKELVEAISELLSIIETFKNLFFEWFGVPDILRGASDPAETATAQNIKSSAGHDRFKQNKRLIAGLARDSLELMLDLALEVFTVEQLFAICGAQFFSEYDQARFVDAVTFLKNDQARVVRIEIDTDTMGYIDEREKSEKASYVSNLLINGLEKAAQMLEVSPLYASVALKALLVSLEAMTPGRDFIDDTVRAVSDLVEQAMAAAANPPPPPPDYEGMKLEIQQQKNQMDAQVKMRDVERKEFEAMTRQQGQQLEAQAEAFRLQLDQVKLASDEQSQMYAAQVDNFKLMLEQQKFESDQRLQAFLAQLEAQRVAIEQFKAQVQAAESQLEEIRLARETDMATIELLTGSEEEKGKEKEAAAPPSPPQIINVQTPPISLTVEGAKPSKKSFNITYDEAGNARVDEEDVI